MSQIGYLCVIRVNDDKKAMEVEFQHTVARIRPQMLHVAQRMLGDDEEAEDVVQDALLKLWQLREDPVRNVEALARVMVRNMCLDLIRKRKVTVDVEEMDMPEPTERDELIDKMLLMVEKLPTMQQTILRMRHMDGMEMSAIALMLGTTEEAVRQSLSRARRKVFQQMKKGGSAL